MINTITVRMYGSIDSKIGEKSTPNGCRRVCRARVNPNSTAPVATRPARHAPKMTSATAIQPRPAVRPSLHAPTIAVVVRYAPGEACECAADQHRHCPRAQDRMTCRVGCRCALAYGTKTEPDTGPIHDEPGSDPQRNGEIGDRCCREHGFTDPGDVLRTGMSTSANCERRVSSV